MRAHFPVSLYIPAVGHGFVHRVEIRREPPPSQGKCWCISAVACVCRNHNGLASFKYTMSTCTCSGNLKNLVYSSSYLHTKKNALCPSRQVLFMILLFIRSVRDVLDPQKGNLNRKVGNHVTKTCGFVLKIS